ncbi:MAG TPA: hypothetical protein VNO31_18975 [Umezawaea sp.]|nr:hypothetical protein [Umezawaea sp.]
MAHNDSTSYPRTTAAILRAARNGLFTSAQAERLIERVHAYTVVPDGDTTIERS